MNQHNSRISGCGPLKESPILKTFKKLKICAVFLIAFALWGAPARAAMKEVKDAGAEAAHVESYLNGLKTAQARFVQTTHDGTQLVGTFYLDRPGKLRFQYDLPIEDFVVADGVFIYFYDAELKEQTNAPIGQTLADFLLRKDIKLSGDVAVQSIRRGGGYLQVEMVQSADPEAGSLMLAFTEEPFALKKWRVVDGQGLITEVELFYLKTGIAHPAGLFVYKDPAGTRALNE
ncbi:MAG: outer membrane lipoprotein carrier protein LolA [Alphaproteobacteria bacterium]|nr:outer membrane lipoprotein carrier protein LolA [Alphaproteobacteria bacterium]